MTRWTDEVRAAVPGEAWSRVWQPAQPREGHTDPTGSVRVVLDGTDVVDLVVSPLWRHREGGSLGDRVVDAVRLAWRAAGLAPEPTADGLAGLEDCELVAVDPGALEGPTVDERRLEALFERFTDLQWRASRVPARVRHDLNRGATRDGRARVRLGWSRLVTDVVLRPDWVAYATPQDLAAGIREALRDAYETHVPDPPPREAARLALAADLDRFRTEALARQGVAVQRAWTAAVPD